MTDLITVEFTNLQKVITKLSMFDRKVSKRILTAGVRAGARKARQIEKRVMYVRTGLAKKSLKLKSKTNPKTGELKVSVTGSGHKGYYFSFVEAGTKRIKGRHVIEKAMEQNQSLIFRTVATKIEQRITEEMRK